MEFNFAGEQFWGRAARAPRSRKRFEALVIFGGFFCRPICLVSTRIVRVRERVPSLRDSLPSLWVSPHLRARLMNSVAGATGPWQDAKRQGVKHQAEINWLRW